MCNIDFHYYKEALERAGIVFASGLTSAEVLAIQEEFQFVFPPDLAEFLMYALPVSFVDWRNGERSHIQEVLAWPYEGICFDIQHNAFWMDEWGPQPADFDEACQIAKVAVERAPKLIPIFGHRYIPDTPHEYGNPVFSVCQTDIIYYGRDLFHYYENEFYWYFGKSGFSPGGEIKHIDFWTTLIEINA